MARSFVGWDGGVLRSLVDRSLEMGDHWAWSHVIQSLYGKTSDWSDCFKIRCHEMKFSNRFGRCSLGRSGENNSLESRGVRVLTKCSRRKIGVVATQTI